MSAPTPVVIYNSGRGVRRYGRNTAQVFATWASTDQFAAVQLLSLTDQFLKPPYPLGFKVTKVLGSISGTMTEMDLAFKFATPITFISPVPKDYFLYPMFDGGISPTSELLDACTTSWNAGSNVTQADETTIVVDSGTSQKLSPAAAFTTGILGYATTYSAVNAADWDSVVLYLYSSIALQPGDLSFCIDDTASIASPVETLVIDTAIPANTWIKVRLHFSTTNARTAIISHGLKANRDFGACDIYIDNIRYSKRSQKYPSFDSGSGNANSVGYGNITCTTVGAASADRLYLQLEFEYLFSHDDVR